MKRILLSLALLAGTVFADTLPQQACTHLPLPAAYQTPGAGTSISRFDRKPLAPYLDAATGCLVFECCMPPKVRNGVSHFYTFVYKLSADGRTLTRTSRMWNSNKTEKAPTPYTDTLTTDRPFCFAKGSLSYVFSVDAQGTITRITMHGTDPLLGKELPPDGRVMYPRLRAQSIVHYLP